MTKRTKTTRVLIIIFAIVLLIEIGYALLSSNLRINGNTRINQARWDVHFENIQVTSGSVEATNAATIAADRTTVDYGVTLTNPGDFYEFTVDAVNKGTIDAMVSTIVNIGITEEQQKYLAYTVSYSDGETIAEKQLLAANKTETLKVRVEFKKDIQASDLPTEAVDLTLEFSAEYVQADSSAVEVMHIVCKRATALHTEVCNQTNGTFYCSGGGYTNGDIVTYGNLGTAGAAIAVGDAFDCDVNGDGTFDAETERFYYVSDLDANPEYAVLAYYNNVKAGVPDKAALFAYDTSNTPRTNGPVTAIEQLPTTAQWSKVSLTSTTRAIKDEKGTTYKENFSYAGKAARMLTVDEVESACGITAGRARTGELDNCKYLMENTKYTDNSLTDGYWLESVISSSSFADYAWIVYGMSRTANQYKADIAISMGVRPAIEVPKSKIAL